MYIGEEISGLSCFRLSRWIWVLETSPHHQGTFRSSIPWSSLLKRRKHVIVRQIRWPSLTKSRNEQKGNNYGICFFQTFTSKKGWRALKKVSNLLDGFVFFSFLVWLLGIRGQRGMRTGFITHCYDQHSWLSQSHSLSVCVMQWLWATFSRLTPPLSIPPSSTSFLPYYIS